MSYVVGTGWWCSDPRGEQGPSKVGHRVIRSLPWHEIWKQLLFRYARPAKTICCDSVSPVRPQPDPRVEFVSLDRNYQYAGLRFNGWIRGFMVGAWYAFNCESDFVYVEQDCLVVGSGWVEELVRRSEGRPLFGSAYKSPVQQSLVFLPRAVIPSFLFGLTKLEGRMTCEERFQRVGKPLGARVLPFGVGRVRPIDFRAGRFYAQHWTAVELVRLAAREGIQKEIDRAVRSVEKGA